MFNERQTEYQPAIAPCGRRVGLPEAVEDEWQEFRLDALASVADCDADMIGGALHPQLDSPAFGRELDRVCEEVPYHLLQARRVAERLFRRRAEIGDELDTLRLSRRAHRVERGFERRNEIDR